MLCPLHFFSGSASKNESSGSLFKGFRGFHFTPMDARNVLAVKDMIKVSGTTEAEYDTKFKVRYPPSVERAAKSRVTNRSLNPPPPITQTFDAASKLVAGTTQQDIFTCPVALLPYNISQVELFPFSVFFTPQLNVSSAETRRCPG